MTSKRKMVRVALLISGQPRYVDSVSYKYIKQNLLDKYECDVYCHAWMSDQPQVTSPWSGLPNFICKGNEDELIQSLYKPKGFECDPPMDPTKAKLRTNSCHIVASHTLLSMYTSMQRVYKVYEKTRPKDVKYDVWIRLRYDVIPKVVPDLNTLPKDKTYFTFQHLQRPCLANNFVIYTQEEAMKAVYNIVDRLDEFYDQNCKFNDEDMIYQVMTVNKLPWTKCPEHVMRDYLPVELGFNMNREDF